MTQFAQQTTISIERTRAEIEEILHRYGADQFAYGRDDSQGVASIQFRSCGRLVRFVIYRPCIEEFTKTDTGRDRNKGQAEKFREQAWRQRWRALLLCVKGKLEAVECGFAQFEEEFLSNIVVPGGGTVGDMVIPQLEEAYQTGKLPDGYSGAPVMKRITRFIYDVWRALKSAIASVAFAAFGISLAAGYTFLVVEVSWLFLMVPVASVCAIGLFAIAVWISKRWDESRFWPSITWEVTHEFEDGEIKRSKARSFYRRFGESIELEEKVSEDDGE